jgi:hypothetical protein
MEAEASAADMDEEWHEEPPRRAQQMPPAGLLTAGLWDDNLNFDTFIDYRRSVAADQMPGLLPVSASVHERTAGEHQHGPKKTIDISFVIDATGSMGDEIAYLQSEFDSLSREIEATYANSRQRWSLVVYRDEGDEYVVRGFDFEDSPRAFRKQVMRQSAGGGGDYPEAAHLGLREAVSERWRSDPRAARLLFWVADAPHHDDQAHAMSSAIHAAYRRDIHIYPVASSGVDELTELTMRSAAQLTGGRYIFLTDDSGVGLSHKEPTIPCYHVTSLRDAIMRSVAMEMEGEYLSPHPNEIVRTTGAPDRGRCRNVHPHDQVAHGWRAGGWDRDTW